ncbi:MAG: hypothetical protein JEZ03_09125 [Bacteroidales bacterium]|nr:hypothetical protein [Bacteroidales bacterium]
MIKRISFLSLIVLLTLTGFSQETNSPKTFIYLYNDTIREVSSLKLKYQAFDKNIIEADGHKYYINQVRFYQNEKGFFANTSSLSYAGSFHMVYCVQKGNINLFEPDVNTYLNNINHVPFYNYNPVTIMNVASAKYYNKGFDFIKMATYDNLSDDLSDNPTSMMHLEKYKKQSRLQNIVTIAGVAITAGGIIGLISTSSSDKEVISTPYFTGAIIGSGILGFNYIFSLSKPEHLKKAIKAYNE